MTNSVLDMIDNVVGRHGDAMRWSPNPPPTPPPPTTLAEAHEALSVAFAGLVESFPPLAQVLADFAAQLMRVLDPCPAAQVHAEYLRRERR